MSGPGVPAILAPPLAGQKLTPPDPSAGGQDLKKAAQEFESLLMSMLLQNLRKTTLSSGLLGDSGQAKGTLQYLMDQAVVEKAVQNGKGLGLAPLLEAAWAGRQAPAPPGKFPGS